MVYTRYHRVLINFKCHFVFFVYQRQEKARQSAEEKERKNQEKAQEAVEKEKRKLENKEKEAQRKAQREQGKETAMDTSDEQSAASNVENKVHA